MPADPQVVSALQDKLHDLRSAVTTYEEQLERTRHELAVVTATLSLFKRGEDRPSDHRPAHIRNLFKQLGSRGRLVCCQLVPLYYNLPVGLPSARHSGTNKINLRRQGGCDDGNEG